MNRILLSTKVSFKNISALMFLFMTLLGFSLSSVAQTNIIPTRTDVAGFPSWTDVTVSGTTYIQLLVAGASITTPSMDFTQFTGEKLNFDARTFGGGSAVEHEITISVSVNGAPFENVTTRTPINNSMLPQAQVDLSNYEGTDVRVRFSVAGVANGVGAGLDFIKISGIFSLNVAPAVITSAASDITVTSATLGGNVTATGGKDISANGSVYSLTANNANPSIGGAGVVQIETGSPAIGTGSFSNFTGSVLDANTQYSFKAYATNTNGTSYGSVSSFYTLALVPGQATVSNPSTTTLQISLDANANPEATTFAIMEQGGMYVQANGSLGATAVFQTIADWGLITVTGLVQNTEYTFSVKARNGDLVETASSSSASGTTLLNTSPTIVLGNLDSFGDVCVGEEVVRSFTFDAENLTSEVIAISGPAGFTFSSSEMGAYASTLIISTTPTMSNVMVYVKFSPTAAGSYDGMIVVEGGGTTANYSISAVATGVTTAATVVTGNVSNDTSIQATLAGSFEMGCYAVTEYGFEYSTTNGFVTGTNVNSANEIAGAFSATVVGLEPNTTYYYKAYATDGTTLIYGNQRSFTTEGIATPIAEDATDITSSGFTANWTGVPGATGYRIDVSTNPNFGTTIDAVSTTETFTAIGGGAAGSYVTRTWTGAGGVTWTAYKARTDKDMNGDAITLRDQTGAYLMSEAISGGLSNLTFDVQQQFSGSGGEVEVEILSGTGFSTVNSLGAFPYASAISTFNSGALSIAGDYKIRITNTSTLTRVSIDDLTFTSLSEFTPSFVIEDADAGNGTLFIVTGLNENTTYYYRVRATSTNSVSGNSNTIMVTTIGAPSTFGSIAIDGAVCEGSDATFTITGLVANSTNTIEYNIGGGATASVAGIVADENGVGMFTMSFAYAQNGLVFTVTSVERTDISSSVVAVTDSNTVTLEINELLTMYADADGDGFGDVNVMMTSCEMLEGYVLNSDDCDGNNADVNPDATEILYNGIDDNCDGMIDEGNQITTQVVASQCGSTLSNIYSIINITPNSAATAYRFRVVDISDNSTQYLVSTLPSFRITDLASFAYDKSYTVSVEIQRAGVWLGYYGAECRINTPSLANGLTFVQCGETINIYKGINTGVVQGATGYRFRITNVTNPGGANEVQVIDTTVPYFQLTSLASYEYNTTYSVQVAIKTTGAYTAYGPACDISTLPWSALPLSIRQCGNTYTSIYKGINAGVIPNVSGYRFRFTNLATNVQEVITSAISYTSLSQLTTYVAGASYSVEVAVKTTEDFGPYGPACTINAPAAIASNGTIVSNADFKVVASPNPFSDTFAVNVSTTADSNVEVKVYDMIGKLLEVRSVQAGELEAQRLGNGYPSGVYNVIITQDQTVKTLKVIKR